MGAVDEEISAMLQSGHHSCIGQGSLAGVMAPAVTAGLDHFPYNLYNQGGYVGNHSRPVSQMQRSTSMPGGGLRDGPTHVGSPPQHRGSPPQSRPAFNMEDKYVLESRSEVLDASILRNGSNYGVVYENSVPSSMTLSMPVLHHYHSAPANSVLADTNEEQIGNTVMSSMFTGDGLNSITENMDVERMGSGNSNPNEFEHYLAPENDFSGQAAFPSLRKEVGTPDSFGSTSKSSKNGLFSQTSLPSAGLSQLNSAVQDRMAENGSGKSSSRDSDDNNHLINGYTALIYTQEDFTWKSPTSPAKRQRGLDGDSETSSGSAEGSTYRNCQHSGLVRHMSLPSTNGGPNSPGLEDNHYGAVPMRTRAKRGCATHPRSIAERVRRTKISERMKRLQDLVPNMDKQTNTSDMLDETVEYVKSLQRKVQELSDTVARLKADASQRAKNSNNNNSSN
ncbi:uncharacterized protein [Physcomitrium patens]|nr:transcription factor bHLH130-like isoform X2 [Physcomitrium patens]XP_024396898.1 transcription factor bHLH130-like isoform X2 [Physcomitrium patens]XP_024396899.1 transcription factor bHLH130-like isoform X2 [Physcomitrium patens]XP_024396900.1 transcription factor bHLH130-like isoform X2 [Physcomitrium patens]PNR39038.1 hypothetical protein PHYPA_019316 [Physcomitrium patens]|eukprot:XP_024396897.1 transcription factor bHLH130-like isoform X2 [Physcomitrella patens]